MDRICVKCQLLYKDNEVFCANCGSRLEQKVEENAQTPQLIPAPQSQPQPVIQQVIIQQAQPAAVVVKEVEKKKKTSGCALFLIILIIFACVNVFRSTSDNSGTQNDTNRNTLAATSQSVTQEPTAVPPPVVQAKVARTANLRSLPQSGDDQAVIGRLSPETELTIEGRNEQNDWFVIQTERGLHGWVSASLLTIDEESSGVLAELPIVADDEQFFPRDNDKSVHLAVWNVEIHDRLDFLRSSSNTSLWLIGVRIDNIAKSKSIPYNPLYFTLKDASGFEYDTTIYPGTRGLGSGELQTDESVSGYIVFEVPDDAKDLVLTYKPLVIGGDYKQLRIPISD